MHLALAPVSTVGAADRNPVYDRFVRDFQSLPGVQSVSWAKSAPGEVRIKFVTDGFRRLADNVLRDAIDGVKLVLSVGANAPAPVPGSEAWADNVSEMARAVRSLPGVLDSRSMYEHGQYSTGFSVRDEATRDRLRALINENFSEHSIYFWVAPAPKP